MHSGTLLLFHTPGRVKCSHHIYSFTRGDSSKQAAALVVQISCDKVIIELSSDHTILIRLPLPKCDRSEDYTNSSLVSLAIIHISAYII